MYVAYMDAGMVWELWLRSIAGVLGCLVSGHVSASIHECFVEIAREYCCFDKAASSHINAGCAEQEGRFIQMHFQNMCTHFCLSHFGDLMVAAIAAFLGFQDRLSPSPSHHSFLIDVHKLSFPPSKRPVKENRRP